MFGRHAKYAAFGGQENIKFLIDLVSTSLGHYTQMMAISGIYAKMSSGA